jgi:hypothetical protein
LHEAPIEVLEIGLELIVGVALWVTFEPIAGLIQKLIRQIVQIRPARTAAPCGLEGRTEDLRHQ